MRFSDTLIADLRSFARAGNGAETGGILTGEIIGDELRLNACEEVPSEQPGPSYTLNAGDRIRLEEVLAARNGAAGYFRVFAGQDPAPTDIDPQFIQRYFSTCDCVYMTIRAESADRCVATVVWLRDGEPLPLDGPSTFPLEPGGVPMLRVRPALPPGVRARFAAASDPPPRSHPLWKPVLACLLLGTLAGAGFELWSLNRHAPDDASAATVQPPSPSWWDLQLDAHPSSGQQVDITWSADAVRGLNASDGKLSITDGAFRHDFSLGSDLVRSGKFHYNSAHSNLAVRLIVMSGGRGIASDSVRLSSTAAAVTPPKPAEPAVPDKAETGPTSTAAVVPPAAVRQVQPEIPAGIRSRLVAEVVIPVEVRVSDRGRVLSAQVENTSSSDGLHRYLAGQAEKAARGWQFTPARTRTGTPIASSKTIEFVFTP